MSDSTIPGSGSELRSVLDADGTLTVSLHRFDVTLPTEEQVLIRVEAAPINPSDLSGLFGGADLDSAFATNGPEGPAVSAMLPPHVDTATLAGRVGTSITTGNEGAGTVIAAGTSSAARALLGRTVAFRSGNAYADYRTLHVAQCLLIPDGVSAEDAAAALVNPLTALGIVGTMQLENHSAMVHTVGASNLGLMLNRLCLADGVPLVNIVRRPDQVGALRREGALHVCDSSSESFLDDMADAFRKTGATVAFDAIGGGELSSTVLSCMVRVLDEHDRNGADALAQIYVYGSLDTGATILHRDFGKSWAIGGWSLAAFLARIGQQRADELRRRVAEEITTTFASRYGMHLSLREALDPDTVRRYGRMASGDKALIVPQR